MGHTRSHSEHGSQATCRRWYLAFGPGRVGRRRIPGPPREIAGALPFLPAGAGRPPAMPTRTFPCNPFEENVYIAFDEVSKEAIVIDPGFYNEEEFLKADSFLKDRKSVV